MPGAVAKIPAMGPVDSRSWRDDASRHYRWEAFDLIAAGHHELGVVAAQVHLEAQLRFALRRAATDGVVHGRDLDDMLRAVGRPTDAPVRDALAAMGVDLADAQLREPLDEHLERARTILGRAGQISRDEAQASLDAIDALWAELARTGSSPSRAEVPGIAIPEL
jgi:HEPN domain-containing protein